MSEPMIPLSQVLVYEVCKLGAFRQRREDAAQASVEPRRPMDPARVVLASIRQIVRAPRTPHIREMFC